jgi:hypothetical protein
MNYNGWEASACRFNNSAQPSVGVLAVSEMAVYSVTLALAHVTRASI